MTADGDVTVDALGIVRVGGTGADDNIRISGQCGAYLTVTRNGVVVRNDIPLAAVSEIRVWSRAGDDRVELVDLLVPALLHGGLGDDTLTGAAGDGLIFGGSGSDAITGAAGNDVLVGQDGADRIVGSAGDDMLMSGNMAYDLTDQAVRQISFDWAVNKTADQEEGILDETLVADGAADKLTGSSGSDWFIIGSADRITDLKKDNNNDGDLVTVL